MYAVTAGAWWCGRASECKKVRLLGKCGSAVVVVAGNVAGFALFWYLTRVKEEGGLSVVGWTPKLIYSIQRYTLRFYCEDGMSNTLHYLYVKKEVMFSSRDVTDALQFMREDL